MSHNNSNTTKTATKVTTQAVQGQSTATKPRVVPASSIAMQVRNGAHVRQVKGR